MKRTTTILLFPFLYTLVLAIVSASTFAQSSITQSYAELMKAELENTISDPETQFRGGTFTISVGDSIWTHSFGRLNPEGDPIENDGRYFFRSHTKMIVSTIILQLMEEGKLSLEDTIGDHIDPINNVDPNVKIKDMLNHNTNLCNFISNSWGLILAKTDSLYDTREVLNQTVPSSCETNSYNYSDTAFEVMGLIIEAVTDSAGEDVFRERIFEPLGLVNTELSPKDLKIDQVNGLWATSATTGNIEYAGDESGNAFLSVQKFCCGVVSTTEDMLTFTKALTSGFFLEQETLDMQLTPKGPSIGLADCTLNSSRDCGWLGYGYGINALRRFDQLEEVFELWGHGGAGLHTSGTSYSPDKEMGISIAFNTNIGNDRWKKDELENELYELLNNCIEAGGCSDISLALSTDELSDIPDDFILEQNYPNPFNPSTNIPFSLPQAGNVSLRVYNMLGQEVASLVNGRKAAGYHTVNFDASGLSSGVYIYQIRAGSVTQTRKMMLVK